MPIAENWEPLPYMERAVQHLLENAHAGLFLKPGMRKTSITLAAYDILRDIKMVGGLLVIAPLRVIHTSWPREVKKWKEFEHLSVGILHGPKKDKVLAEKHDVYLINYEGLEWLFGALGAKRWPFDMLVVDESTKLKNISSKRFKLLKPHLKKFKRRVILTGTPMANHLIDIFGQIYVMDMGQTFGAYITHWRNRFFYPTGFGGFTWAPKEGTEEAIQEMTAPTCFYAHDDDWLKLPPILEKDIEIELPPKAMAAYLQMEDTLRLDFKEGRINASNAAVATGKCRQIANGGVFIDASENKWQQIHDAKTEAVVDLIEELSGAPALVVYEYRHDLERLQKALGKDTPFIGRGGVKPAKMPELINEWNRGRIPYIIVNAQSMAHGVDGLQEAGRAVIWHSLTYNYDDYFQLIRRLQRSGQRERVLVAHIIAKGTVDRAVLGMVRAKGKTQRNFFDALRRYWNTES